MANPISVTKKDDNKRIYLNADFITSIEAAPAGGATIHLAEGCPPPYRLYIEVSDTAESVAQQMK